MHETKELRVPAIEVTQSPGRVLYTFAVDGKLVQDFATISRVRREKANGVLEGYQRPEIRSHIEEIRSYLESDSPMIPNAVVVAFDSRVRFEPSVEPALVDYVRGGTLIIPIDAAVEEETRPGFIVDGQQRLAAIRDADIEGFPICVTAFITDDVREQSEQFILVNSTRPLPKGLIYELLPGTTAQLPTLLHRRRFPAQLVDRLNRDEDSPFKGIIQTPTNPDGLVKDNSVLRMLEGSLSDGVLYRLREERLSEDPEPLLAVLKASWTAAKLVFKAAWGQPPRRSRLMHGAGIMSLGFVIDAIAERYRSRGLPSMEEFAADLEPIKEVCRWTDGYWDFGPGIKRKWNEIQNTTKDIQLLTNYLLVQYKARVWSRTTEADLEVGQARQKKLFAAG